MGLASHRKGRPLKEFFSPGGSDTAYSFWKVLELDKTPRVFQSIPRSTLATALLKMLDLCPARTQKGRVWGDGPVSKVLVT